MSSGHRAAPADLHSSVLSQLPMTVPPAPRPLCSLPACDSTEPPHPRVSDTSGSQGLKPSSPAHRELGAGRCWGLGFPAAACPQGGPPLGAPAEARSLSVKESVNQGQAWSTDCRQGPGYIKTASQRTLQMTWVQGTCRRVTVCNGELAQSRHASWRRQHLETSQECLQGSPMP